MKNERTSWNDGITYIDESNEIWRSKFIHRIFHLFYFKIEEDGYQDAIGFSTDLAGESSSSKKTMHMVEQQQYIIEDKLVERHLVSLLLHFK